MGVPSSQGKKGWWKNTERVRSQRGWSGGWAKGVEKNRLGAVCLFLIYRGAACSDITGFPLHFQPGHRLRELHFPRLTSLTILYETPAPFRRGNACGICDERASFPRSYFRKSKSRVWWKESPDTRFESWLKRERIDCFGREFPRFSSFSFFFFIAKERRAFLHSYNELQLINRRPRTFGFEINKQNEPSAVVSGSCCTFFSFARLN